MRGMQVKLWDLLWTRAIPERLRGVLTTRHYTNPCLPLPLPLSMRCSERVWSGKYFLVIGGSDWVGSEIGRIGSGQVTKNGPVDISVEDRISKSFVVSTFATAQKNVQCEVPHWNAEQLRNTLKQTARFSRVAVYRLSRSFQSRRAPFSRCTCLASGSVYMWFSRTADYGDRVTSQRKSIFFIFA